MGPWKGAITGEGIWKREAERTSGRGKLDSFTQIVIEIWRPMFCLRGRREGGGGTVREYAVTFERHLPVSSRASRGPA